VTGKGGSGRTTVTAALALAAARAGKRVLAVDVDAKGDLAAALGSQSAGASPHLVQHNLSVISLRAEESFQEYLRVFFKVPRVARLTPLARVFDFIATGVPGPRDMLVVGKIAFEERRREPNGGPVWDLILADCAASGHAVSHLAAPRAMMTLVRGGMIRGQVEWVDAMVRDSVRTAAVICALPEEMPVVEAIELHARLRTEAGVAVVACLLNRAFLSTVSAAQRTLVHAMLGDEHRDAVIERLGASPLPFADSLHLAERLHDATARRAKELRSALPVPVVPIPLQAARPGLATARAVAETLGVAAA